MRPWTAYRMIAPAMLLLAVFLLAPMLLLLRVSLYESPRGKGFYTPDSWTTQHYENFTGSFQLELLAFSLGFAVAVAVLAVGVGYWLALFLQSLPAKRQPFALSLILLPKLAGTLTTLFGLQRLLPRGLISAILAEAYLIAPYAVLVLFLQLRAIDPTLGEAARGLGATSWQIFRRVTWPLSWPGVLLASELSLVWGFGAFAGPLFLGRAEDATLSVELYRQAFEYGQWPQAAAEAVLLLILVMMLQLAFRLQRVTI